MKSLALYEVLVLGMGFMIHASAQEILPKSEPPFNGKIGRAVAESTPDFPKGMTAPAGAPNVLLILTDDVGFGASSTFGGPIPTPGYDKLARAGLRYNTFHTTALCSPSRAALISGRNHHTVSTGIIMEAGTGYPGYNSLMSKSCGTVAEVLKQNGWNTSWFGKNHNVPDWQTSQAGPFDLWPTGLGFEYFYGFIGGDTDQWNPALFEGTRPIEVPPGKKDYHFDADLADQSIAWIRQQNSLAPDKPFFAYFAPGLTHAPHQAPKEWIAKFKGQFDQGWDKVREETHTRQLAAGVIPSGTALTPRPDVIPAWDSLSTDQKKLYARMMEVYAATLNYCDHNIGRVIQAVEETGEMDNTLIIYIQGDNGASAEGSMQGMSNEVGVMANGVEETEAYLLSIMDDLGGPLAYNHYPVGWAFAMCSPFQWSKSVASHFGGTRNGLVVSWPNVIKQVGEVRSQFCSIIDIAPTILEAAKLPQPDMINGVKQKPMEGKSLVYSFAHAKAPTQHPTQYFELIANRGIYHDGWMANTTPIRMPWKMSGPAGKPEEFSWELYHVAEDFSQSKNLAAENPSKLKELQALFDVEAKKYNVYPLDSSYIERGDVRLRPSLTRGRSVFTYYPGTIRVPEGTAPDTKNKDLTFTAEVDIPAGGAEGVLATQGGRFGGWALLVQDGKPEFAYAYSNQARHKTSIASTEKLTPGKHTIQLVYKYEGPGIGGSATGTLNVDGKQVAQGKMARTIATRYSLDETFDVGQDTGTPVLENYLDRMPFVFTGTLGKFTIELGKSGLPGSEHK